MSTGSILIKFAAKYGMPMEFCEAKEVLERKEMKVYSAFANFSKIET